MLVDSSIVLRTLEPHHPHYEIAAHALEVLPKLGETLEVVAQNLIEFWVVATRPVAQNGLGLGPAAALVELQRIKSMFVLRPETDEIYDVWERLVTEHGVSGKPAHDARLVAAMRVHRISSVLTFDRRGFSRFQGVLVVDPRDVR